jgi:hypothetical protein
MASLEGRTSDYRKARIVADESGFFYCSRPFPFVWALHGHSLTPQRSVINLIVPRMRVQIASLMFVIAAVGGSLTSVASPANASSVPRVHDGLHLQYVNIPTMHEGYVFVSGTIPQIDYNYLSFGHHSIPSVGNVLRINSNIESLATTAEKSYWRTLVKLCSAQTKSFSDLKKEPGYYETTSKPGLVLANDDTLSFIVPTFWSVCQGTGNEGAISSTYSLRSGRTIDLLSVLFTNRLAGERQLAKLVSNQFNEGKSVGDRCPATRVWQY